MVKCGSGSLIDRGGGEKQARVKERLEASAGSLKEKAREGLCVM